MNVLVIEDNHSDFHMMRNLCEQLPDCSIFVSQKDLQDGLQCLAGGDIDVVFLGLPLSGHDSLAALQQVHQQAGTAPVIVLLSTADDGSKRMLQNGAQDVLQRDGLTPQLLEHSLRFAVQCKHLQDQLEFSDTRYHIISDLISDFAWSVRCEAPGRFTFEWITGPFHRLLGMPVAEIDLVTDWQNYIFSDDLERVQAHIRKVYAGEADGIEFRVRDRSGKIHWLIQRTCSVKDEVDGQVVRIYGAGREITERKEMEDRQRQDQEAYRALVERSLQELYILQDGRVCFANPTALNNTGYSLPELQAFSQDEILNVIYASDPASISNLDVSEPGKIPARHEFRRARKDGSISWVAALSAQIQYQGRPAVQVALVDITERVQAEEAYRALVQNSLQELLILQDGRIVFANPSAVRNSGYELNELLSFSAEELLKTIHPDDVDELISIESNILAGKPYADSQEMRVIQKSGAVRWVEAMRTRIEFHGRPATQTIQFDITERKLTEERLRYRHAIEGLVTSISTRFINLTSDSVDSGIRHSLQSLGRFAGSERCYVYLLSSDFARFVDGYEWCHNGVKSRIEGLIGESFEPNAWSLSYFKDRMPIYVPCVADIPPEGASEKRQWESEGIQSVLAIPLILNNMLFGFWGFDFIQKQKTWAGEDIRLLRMMGDVFVNALARKQIEQALRQARQELDLTLNSISDALWTGEVSQDGQIEYRYMSPVIEKITGRSIEFFKPFKSAWTHIIHPQDINTVEEAWSSLQKDQLHFVEIQFRIVLPDGCIRWVRNSLTGTRLPDGHVRLDAVLSDITERKRAEEGLRQRYDIEGLVTNLTTKFINVESRMVDRQIRNALKAIGEYTGLDRCYVVMLTSDGKEIERRYDWAVTDIDGTYTGAYISLAPFHWSMNILRRFEAVYVPRMDDLPPDAGYEKAYWIENGVHSVLNIPLGMNDKLVGYFGFASDTVEKVWAEEDIRLLRLMGDVFTNVLARRKAEEALIEREAQYRLLADGITDVVALHELDGSFVYVSPSAEKLVGRRPADLIGIAPAEVILEEDWLPVKHAVDSRLSQGQDVTIQWRCRGIDGSLIWMETSLHPILKEDRPFRYLSTSRNVTERKQAEEALHEANRQLQVSIVEMEQRNQEVTLLNEMGDLLQGCLSVQDVYQIVEVYCPRLFPNFSGAVLMTNPSRKLVETMATWGYVSKELAFNPEQCWALRRGRIHSVNLAGPDLICEHVTLADNMSYLCIPMAAQGETLGIFHLQAPKGQFEARRQQLAIMLAERLSLALSNLRLRDILQRQSIRDALTGLFNRRYMETTVERELRQAARQKESIGFIMMDIDYFKDFNDTYGHGAGDLLLSALGDYLQANIRASDIACRYGGDEFVLIMPQASISDTYERAEQMRQDVKKLTVDFGSSDQNSITISMGISAYPDHGFTMDRLLSVADKALYSAKNSGRDQICIAPRLE